MVQRKVAATSKFGVQADHVKLKPERRLAISQLKPSPSQHLQDGKSSRSADFKKKIKKPRSAKLPDQIKTSIPQNQKLPNYMKNTSSSDAKKEHTQSQVSITQHQKNTKHGSGYNKPARTLTRLSSLKSVRTLTKTPSFKLARANASAKKKRSEVAALCADIDMQKATCSSTLKDSKFPDFLKLNPGGNEAEGTSVARVCPYTYCSLNGHHHKPSPPLKMFLKAKRRALRIQKSVKRMEALSPRRAMLRDDGEEEGGRSSPVIIDEKPGYEEADTSVDFNVQMYAKDMEDEGQVTESISDGSPKSEIDFEEGVEEQKVEDADEGNESNDAMIGSFCFDSDFEGDGTNSEGTDMEWDEVDEQVLYSVQTENISYLQIGFPLEVEKSDFQGELEIMSNVSCCNEDVLVEELLQEQEVIDGESQRLGIQFEEIEPEGTHQNPEYQHQLTSIEGLSEESSNVEETKGETEFIAMLVSPAVEPQPVPEVDPQPEDGEANNAIYASDGALDDHDQQETISVQSDDIDTCPGNQISDAPQGFTEENDFIKLEGKGEINEAKLSAGVESVDQSDSKRNKTSLPEDCVGEEDAMEAQDNHDSADTVLAEDKITTPEHEARFLRTPKSSDEVLSSTCRKWTIGCKKQVVDSEEESEFNPREPNYLPLVPDPEAEKVDLRHQMMDERKNADEWMLDYALQQTVTKLAPARKRKVALLVEAFESVLPVPRFESRMSHPPAAAFAHTRPIQACN